VAPINSIACLANSCAGARTSCLHHRCWPRCPAGPQRCLRRRRSDEAAELYQRAGDADACARFLLRCAGPMIGAGRGERWRLWCGGLDTAAAQRLPQFDYWHGLSLIEARPQHARALLVRAEARLAQGGDEIGRLLAVAAIVDSYDADWADADGLEHWGAVLGCALAGHALPPLDAATDLRLHSRLACALLSTAFAPAQLAHCAERALQAMAYVSEPAELLSAAAILLRYFDWQDSAARASALITQMALLETCRRWPRCAGTGTWRAGTTRRARRNRRRKS
jgi:LuxR family transcriptional regulator, maltose regulon positive regulatory protein